MTGADGQHAQAHDRAQQANQQGGVQVNNFFAGREAGRPGVPVGMPARLVAADRFRGREALAAELAGAAGTSVVLRGVPGVGKTTLAVDVAHRAIEEHGAHAWLVRAGDGQDVDEAMRSLAYALGASDRAVRTQNTADLVWQRLNALGGPWVLIIDDVADPAALGADGRGHLRTPRTAEGLLIVTSRADDWPTWVRWITVPPLDLVPAGAALLDRAPGAGDAGSAQQLAKDLGALPLALDLAGTHLARTAAAMFPDPDAVSTFDRYRSTIAERLGELARDPRTTLAGWSERVDAAEAEAIAARPLLHLLASFAPAPVPYAALLADLTSVAGSGLFPDGLRRADLDGALLALQRERLVTVTVPANPASLLHTAQVHPLVRAAARATAVTDEHRHLAAVLLGSVAEVRPTGDPEYDTGAWPLWQALSPHAMDLLGEISTARPVDVRVVTASVSAAMTAREFLTPWKAEHAADWILGTAEGLARAALDRTHPLTLAVRVARVGRHAERNGPADRGEAEIREILSISERVLGPHHAVVFAALGTLWAIWLLGEQHDRMIQSANGYLAAHRGSLPPEHDRIRTARLVLAVALALTDHANAAEPHLRDIVAICRRDPAHRAPGALDALVLLAGVCHWTGRDDEAAQLGAEAIGWYEEVYGPGHPATGEARQLLDELTG